MVHPKKSAWAYLAILSASIFAGTLFTHAVAAQTPTPKTRSVQNRVDVNSADLKTLETLPGVGPALAQRIIESRPYRTLEDLDKVKGLGPSKIATLKDIFIFGPTVSTAKSASTSAASKRPSQKPGAPSQPHSASRVAGLTPPRTSTNAPGVLARGEKININKATAEQLERLPGVGPAKARAILDYRSRNGDFKSVESIQQVKGIKAGTFSRIKNVIKVTD